MDFPAATLCILEGTPIGAGLLVVPSRECRPPSVPTLVTTLASGAAAIPWRPTGQATRAVLDSSGVKPVCPVKLIWESTIRHFTPFAPLHSHSTSSPFPFPLQFLFYSNIASTSTGLSFRRPHIDIFGEVHHCQQLATELHTWVS